jgi:NitT/TauT family transport system substrate-binding protein
MEGVNASDEALYANDEYLQQNADAVDALVEELLTVWREINQDPSYVVAQREQYGLLADLPADLEEQVLPYYEEAKATGAFPNNGGGASAAKDDFEFYALAGQLEGDPAELKVEDFWDLGPLERALDKLGEV